MGQVRNETANRNHGERYSLALSQRLTNSGSSGPSLNMAISIAIAPPVAYRPLRMSQVIESPSGISFTMLLLLLGVAVAIPRHDTFVPLDERGVLRLGD